MFSNTGFIIVGYNDFHFDRDKQSSVFIIYTRENMHDKVLNIRIGVIEGLFVYEYQRNSIC